MKFTKEQIKWLEEIAKLEAEGNFKLADILRKMVHASLGLMVLMMIVACDVKVGGSNDTDKSADIAKDTTITEAPCKDDYMVGKTFTSSVVGQQNSMGARQLQLNDKCQLAVTNCAQTLQFPENYQIAVGTTLHAVLQVEITGTTGWQYCMSLGVKTCDVSIYNYGAFTSFWMSCNGETATYSGNVNN